MTEYQAGRYLREYLTQPLLEMQSLDKTAQDSAQLNLKGIQHWEMHHFPKEIIPLTGLIVKNFPCIQLVSL